MCVYLFIYIYHSICVLFVFFKYLIFLNRNIDEISLAASFYSHHSTCILSVNC